MTRRDDRSADSRADPPFRRWVSNILINVIANLIAAAIIYLLGVAIGFLPNLLPDFLPREFSTLLETAFFLTFTLVALAYVASKIFGRSDESSPLLLIAIMLLGMTALLGSFMPDLFDRLWERIAYGVMGLLILLAGFLFFGLMWKTRRIERRLH
ncbi:MAG: hypothetical protein M3460_22445 [Actinomycetota bacterium]|nr:hypothetical protein [Actinomycetota bacterium]